MPGRITELGVLNGATAALTDHIETVDISDTSMAASGTNKRFSLAEVIAFLRINALVGLNQAGLAPDPGATSTGRFLKDDGTWTLPPSAVSGIGDVFPFTYNTSTVESITGNQMRGNNATFTASTKLWVSETTVDGLDVAVGLSRIKAGLPDLRPGLHRRLLGTPCSGSTTDGIDKGTYWEFTVALASSAGTIPGGKVALQSLSTGAVEHAVLDHDDRSGSDTRFQRCWRHVISQRFWWLVGPGQHWRAGAPPTQRPDRHHLRPRRR